MLEPQRLLLFVGYPRSGHSLVGALIDAHPQAIVSHEVDLLARLLAGADRDSLLRALLDTSAQQAAAGRGQGHPGDYWYSYEMPGAWAGRVAGELRVLGDKKGGGSTSLLAEHPGLLNALRARTGLPLSLLHVVRDPFDNIASMVLRGHGSLDEVIARYASLCEVVAGVLAQEPSALTLHHEALLAAPEAELTRLCAFLGLDMNPAWLEAAKGLMHAQPNRSRDALVWSAAQTEAVQRIVSRTPWLARWAASGQAVGCPTV
ncbi:MAG: hypothetical protein H6741_05000 [Alphaproteobacteria bacterium]|nr:hypothetical protein [Alphaproteobacteria bacterium]